MSNLHADLIARLRQGDTNAFDALYWQYHGVVYRNILKFTKDTIVAQDILQEVFTKLWEKRAQINVDQSVAGWLFVISFNLSVNYTRKRLQEQTFQKKLLAIEPDSCLPGTAAVYDEQYRMLESAIRQLSPQRRKVVTLCKLEGKTYEEAAGELNISRNTVKEHLQAAMVNLNEYVKKKSHFYILLLCALFND